MENEGKDEKVLRALAQVVCICKGIPLSKVLPYLEAAKDLAEFNRLTGCGVGQCKGERCGPKLRALLRRKEEKAESQED